MHRGFLDLNKITLAVLKKKRIGDSTQWRTVKRNTMQKHPSSAQKREAQRNHAQKECEAMQRNFFHEADFSLPCKRFEYSIMQLAYSTQYRITCL